ncbi:MAG: SAM-dependent methyltransferase, partial [Comamonas sp.]
MAKMDKKPQEGKPANKKPAAQDVAAQLELKPGQSIELLKALHILTREGK